MKKKGKIGEFICVYEEGEYQVKIYRINQETVAIELPEVISGYLGREYWYVTDEESAKIEYDKILAEYLDNGVEFEMEE